MRYVVVLIHEDGEESKHKVVVEDEETAREWADATYPGSVIVEVYRDTDEDTSELPEWAKAKLKVREEAHCCCNCGIPTQHTLCSTCAASKYEEDLQDSLPEWGGVFGG